MGQAWKSVAKKKETSQPMVSAIRIQILFGVLLTVKMRLYRYKTESLTNATAKM